MYEAQTWRELLRMIISDSREKQRIAAELGIRPITLSRWVNGESVPRPQNLHHLLDVLPQYREQLLDLIREEEGFEEFSDLTREDSSREIPSEFYTKVFVARASITENLRFWSMCTLILQQAIGQLDPDRLGMALWVVRCMPPSGPYNKVRSLRESVGLGTPPWSGNLEQKTMFLGAESLAGNVVTLCRPSAIENLDEEHILMPASRVEHEKSSAVYPILCAGCIAGVFLVSSTQYNYFFPQSRATLVQDYANLIALAFEPEDFYAPEDIALCVMPPHEEQRPRFTNFRHRVASAMIDAAGKNQPLNNIQADILVWKQLEEELLQFAARKQSND